MRMIFEENIENSDYLEFILTKKESRTLVDSGVVKDFATGLFGKRNLNVFIRLENRWEQENAIS